MNICHRWRNVKITPGESKRKAFPQSHHKGHDRGRAACGPQARTKQQRLNCSLSRARGLRRSSARHSSSHRRHLRIPRIALFECCPSTQSRGRGRCASSRKRHQRRARVASKPSALAEHTRQGRGSARNGAHEQAADVLELRALPLMSAVVHSRREDESARARAAPRAREPRARAYYAARRVGTRVGAPVGKAGGLNDTPRTHTSR